MKYSWPRTAGWKFVIRGALSYTTYKKPSVHVCLRENIAMGTRLLHFLPWLLLLLLPSHAVTAFRFTVDDFPHDFTFGAGTAAFQVP